MLQQVRSFGQQLLESVAYLHDLELIHTDLKPENILLVSLEHSKQAGSRQDNLNFLPAIVLPQSPMSLCHLGLQGPPAFLRMSIT